MPGDPPTCRQNPCTPDADRIVGTCPLAPRTEADQMVGLCGKCTLVITYPSRGHSPSKRLESLNALNVLQSLKFFKNFQMLIDTPAFHWIEAASFRPEYLPLFLVLLLSPVQGAAVATNASATLAGENSEQDKDHKYQDQNPGQRIKQSTFHCFPPFLILPAWARMIRIHRPSVSFKMSSAYMGN